MEASPKVEMEISDQPIEAMAQTAKEAHILELGSVEIPLEIETIPETRETQPRNVAIPIEISNQYGEASIAMESASSAMIKEMESPLPNGSGGAASIIRRFGCCEGASNY